MPAYSFKERFVPLILSGEKRQTIRQKRKGQAKPGSILYLYYGMRTKWCKKLKETICSGVKEIIIDKKGNVFIEGKKLNGVQKILLAHDDGFRPEDLCDAWTVMFRWWNQTHSLPFKGDIIYW